MSDLIERLRSHAEKQIDDDLKYILKADALMREAAAALEAVKQERDYWQNLHDERTRMLGEAAAEKEAAESALSRMKGALEQTRGDLDEFMRRLGPRWFLEQGWFPKSVGAREDDARRALTGGKEDG